MTPSDWLLLTVDLAHPRPVQPVQLQKILFLLDRKLSTHQKGMDGLYSFAPYDYGPFDSSVYSDAERLAALGLLSIERPVGQTFKQYQITEAGREKVKEVQGHVDPKVLDFARTLVKWCQGLSFNQLVSAIYRDYPEMKANSVFKG